MRLTLRYLLAYLDDYLLPHDVPKILDPEDFEAIARKIEESEFASSLVERIQDLVRRKRLGAPGETERGTGLDPNTVAEYLDNALPDARVPDFEKVCLESDVHLAEVACCHQILAMVVTEPVEVSDETRQRIYRLPEALVAENDDEQERDEQERTEAGLSATDVEQVEAATVGPPPLRPSSLPATSFPRAKRKKAPGHRAKKSRLAGSPFSRWDRGRQRWIVAGVLLLGILALIWMFVSVPDAAPLSWLLAWRQSNEEIDVPADPSENQEQVAASPAAPEPPTDGNLPPTPPATAATESGQTPPPYRPAPPVPKTSSEVKPTETAKTFPVKPRAEQSPALAEDNDAMPPAGGPLDASRPIKPAAKPGLAAAKSGAETAGLFVSAKEVLLRVNPKTGVWQRLPNESSVFVQDRLLSLPAFRPRLTLTGRMSLELVNGTAISLLGLQSDKSSGIAVEFGQLLAKSDDASGASLRIVVGDRRGEIRFFDADSVAALEVTRTRPSGDPETQPGQLVADLYVVSGGMVWHDELSGKAVKIGAGHHLSLAEQPLESAPAPRLPPWISSEAVSPIDQRAAIVLERETALGRPIILVLRELVGHRQREVRWLAMRSLALVEDYQPLLAALGDPDQSRFWTEQIEQLHAAVLRGPQSAANVRTAMERHYNPQGVGLYEMLWKYQADMLQPDDVNHLVDFLGHELLPLRILAFWNLKNLYQNRMLGYRPDDPAPKRQAAVQKWRELLKANPPRPSKLDLPASAVPERNLPDSDSTMED